MKLRDRPLRLAAALVLAVGWSAALVPAQDLVPDDSDTSIEGRGTLTGKVVVNGAKAAGAVVHAYHIDTGTLSSSEPTSSDGKFRITGLKHGYLDVAVELEGGLYSANQVINLPPSGKLAVQLDLVAFADRPAEYRAQTEAVALPGVSGESTGVAELSQKLRGADFWRSPKGIAILSGIGGGTLLAIAIGSGDEDTFIISPIQP